MCPRITKSATIDDWKTSKKPRPAGVPELPPWCPVLVAQWDANAALRHRCHDGAVEVSVGSFDSARWRGSRIARWTTWNTLGLEKSEKPMGKWGNMGTPSKIQQILWKTCHLLVKHWRVLLAFVHGRVQYHFGVLVTPVCAVIHTVASCKFTQRSQITRYFKAKSW